MTSSARPEPFSNAIRDPAVLDVIMRLHADRKRPPAGGPWPDGEQSASAFADYGFSIHPDQGDLIYLLCRAMGGATRRRFRHLDRHVGALFRRRHA